MAQTNGFLGMIRNYWFILVGLITLTGWLTGTNLLADSNKTAVKEVEAAQYELKEQTTSVRLDQADMKKDIEYIKIAQNDIKDGIKDIKQLLRQ